MDAAQSAGRVSERFGAYLDLIRWSRPAGWLLLLWPTLAALWIAAQGFPGWHLLVVFTLGTILMRSAGCCVNDVADRDFDKHVKRTANRPVTSGRVGVREALFVGAVLALLAFGLVLTTNALTIAMSFGALAIAIAYPFAKRFVSMPQAVLGVAFSFGIPMAFAAVQNTVPPLAWWLLAGNLFWVLAYDTEYAMVDRDDDLKIGMKTSAITLGSRDVGAIVFFYLAYLVFWLPSLFFKGFGQLAGVPWTFVAINSVAFCVAVLITALALAQVVWHWRLIRTRSRDGCFAAFRANHWLGLTLFAGVVVGMVLTP
jgi:4-hydroxybenzoate polyprenyltransferase